MNKRKKINRPIKIQNESPSRPPLQSSEKYNYILMFLNAIFNFLGDHPTEVI